MCTITYMFILESSGPRLIIPKMYKAGLFSPMFKASHKIVQTHFASLLGAKNKVSNKNGFNGRDHEDHASLEVVGKGKCLSWHHKRQISRTRVSDMLGYKSLLENIIGLILPAVEPLVILQHEFPNGYADKRVATVSIRDGIWLCWVLLAPDKHHVVCGCVCVCVSLQTAATATVGYASATRAGAETSASSRRSATFPRRRAKSCAGTRRGWCAPTEVARWNPLSHTLSIYRRVYSVK